MPFYVCLLAVAAGLLLPLQDSRAAAPDRNEPAGVVPTCLADAYNSCPSWMPSQREMRRVLADYFCDAADRGLVRPRVSRVVRAETSQITCAALGPKPNSNFVCAGDMYFIGPDGRTDFVTFSPTMHRQDDGRYAIYEGDDENENEVWHVPSPQSASKVCTDQSLH
ncbi:hypothetical protein G8D19_18145 [Xanthomonas vesicatoria]|uniref:hypothetical protein n=1 Tax=Xanthomonas vesicatoria TaxID=56460 RepID=UPI001E43C744|nr:hypothetical protein [Xanthomonas vesicatoria]MCC8625090.1 hypothetical protein [Xanthomonas vesicatoria]MDG4481860.1 hypothetical protein [Xanthomonas vesicatoria]MDG4490950.1 hypothetical protein [Xanthomonas vesicatoria]